MLAPGKSFETKQKVESKGVGHPVLTMINNKTGHSVRVRFPCQNQKFT